MTNNTMQQLLKQVDLGRDLDRQDLRMLADLAEPFSIPEGTKVFGEGKDHSWVYWIVTGVVTLEMMGSHAGAKSVLTVGSGDLLAWSALLGNKRMTATATTATDVELIGFDSDRLCILCDEDHDIGYRLMRSLAQSLARRLVATRLQMLDLFHDPNAGSA